MSTKSTRLLKDIDIGYELTPKDTEDGVAKSAKRTRKLTEKGRQFQSNFRRKQCQTIQTKLTSLVSKMDKLLVNSDNVHLVENKLELFSTLCLELQEAYEAWRGLLTEQEREIKDSWYHDQERNLMDL